jgi:hypothetical protein
MWGAVASLSRFNSADKFAHCQGYPFVREALRERCRRGEMSERYTTSERS